MRYLEKNAMAHLLKYVVTNNQSPDVTRCNSVEVSLNGNRYSITICINEKKLKVHICEVYRIITKIMEYKGKIVNVDQRVASGETITDEFEAELINELVRLVTYNEPVDNEMYDFYKKEIEPNTECCELNQ
jgi:hypothetical protein